MDTTLFCSLLGIDKETFISNQNKDWKNPQFHKSIPFVFLNKVSPEQYAIFQEHLYKFPGFYPEQRSIRGYPHNHASHVLGYLGEVDKKIIENGNGIYIAGDFIGKSGLEIAYEKELSGGKGVNYILVERAKEIRLRWSGLDGAVREETLTGFAAICAQHEYDHLDGILTLDRISPEDRAAAERALA